MIQAKNKEQIRRNIQTKLKSMANPNIIPTFSIFPSTVDYKDQNILLGLTLKPIGFGEHGDSTQVPEVNFGIKGIIRCQLCRSYMNPYNHIEVSRSSYYCSICGWMNTLPTNYFPGDDNVELSNLTYDIIPFENEFTNKKISEPHIILLIEASYEYLHSGTFDLMISAIQYSLDMMDPQQNILLITYDSTHVSTYDLRGEGTRYILTLDQKPMRESINRQVKEVKENLLKILKMLPDLYPSISFGRTNILAKRGIEYCLQCLLKIGGKIFHFLQTSMPHQGMINAPKPKQQGFFSSTIAYERAAKFCNENSISYSVFMHNNTESNVIELADLCLLTQGSFKLYRKHDPAQQFYYNLIQALTQETYYAGTSRIRLSCNPIETGTKTTTSKQWELSSNGKHNPNHLILYNNLTPQTFFVVTVTLNKNIDDRYLVLQNSCLYTKPDGKIRLRVSNSVIPLSSVLTQINHSINYEGMATYFIKHQIEVFIKSRGVVKIMEERFVSLCQHIIHYTKYQWVQDVTFLCFAMLKNKIGLKQKGMMFSKKKLQQMWLNIIGLLDYNPSQLLTYFIPQLFKVNLEENSDYLPPLLTLVNNSLQPNSAYLMVCGKVIIIYYSQSYNGPKYNCEQQGTLDPFVPLIQQLMSLNNYRHYRVQTTCYNDFANPVYQDFMNYLLYSEGIYELRNTYAQFLKLFV